LGRSFHGARLSAGTLLGPYQIIEALGAGGMGEVYRARDTRLDRSVAIKVLPDHLAANPELRQRFEREARAASSLNHPHICTLHDAGYQDGIHFLVMECLEGETLAGRLRGGVLRLEEAVRIAVHVADALDEAHRHGLIHRDIMAQEGVTAGYNKGSLQQSQVVGQGRSIVRVLQPAQHLMVRKRISFIMPYGINNICRLS